MQGPPWAWRATPHAWSCAQLLPGMPAHTPHAPARSHPLLRSCPCPRACAGELVVLSSPLEQDGPTAYLLRSYDGVRTLQFPQPVSDLVSGAGP